MAEEQASLGLEIDTGGDRPQTPPVDAKATVTIHFLPDDVTVEATPGDSLLEVAKRNGVDIPTGCLRGSCHACEVDTNLWGPVCSCIAAVPDRPLEVELWSDPSW